ncbi:hypothetical protein Nepgr_018639 [Nepenthes gracilis]|uniref:Uncharacterized protein n=1 Tax=Nepenthes gracilis TaxID=150966 RepID=A0AAD3XTL1_NEPGR|nr:hypothetical protein Nepgr_018639 [Nepenthes gracilis]
MPEVGGGWQRRGWKRRHKTWHFAPSTLGNKVRSSSDVPGSTYSPSKTAPGSARMDADRKHKATSAAFQKEYDVYGLEDGG